MEAPKKKTVTVSYFQIGRMRILFGGPKWWRNTCVMTCYTLTMLLYASPVVAVLWVAIHFIRKFW